MSSEARERSVHENSDLCAIDNKRFFIRAVLPLPVNERGSPYYIGIWVEVELGTFTRVLELWSTEDQANEPAFPAIIANEVPSLPSSLGLEARLCLTGPTSRPHVFLSPVEHPLCHEQVHGISSHRAYEYTSYVL